MSAVWHDAMTSLPPVQQEVQLGLASANWSTVTGWWDGRAFRDYRGLIDGVSHWAFLAEFSPAAVAGARRPQQSLEHLCALMRAHGITTMRSLPVMAALGRSGDWMTIPEIAAKAEMPSVATAWMVISALFDRQAGEPPLVKREHPGSTLPHEEDRWALSLEGRAAMEIIDGQLGESFALGEDKTLAAALGGSGGSGGAIIDAPIPGAAAEPTTSGGQPL